MILIFSIEIRIKIESHPINHNIEDSKVIYISIFI